MIGQKVKLINGKFAKVIRDLSSTSVIIKYNGPEGESVRVVSYEEMMAGPIDLCLFDRTLTGTNSNYTPIKRDADGTPKRSY